MSKRQLKLRDIACMIFNAIAAIAILLVILLVIGTFIVMADDGGYLSYQMENPYIDSDYVDWEHRELSEFGSLMLPDEWSVAEDHLVFRVSFEDGTPVASGKWVKKQASHQDAYLEFLSECSGTESADFKQECVQDYFYYIPESGEAASTSGLYQYAASGAADKEPLYCLEIWTKDDSGVLVFVFSDDYVKEEDDLVSICEAIVFSYYYSVS